MSYLYPADLLLPDFTQVDGTRYAALACDQFTSEPAYWEEADALVGDAPSTLRMILPEVYLQDDRATRVAAIHASMQAYVSTVLRSHPGQMLYLRRTCSDGKVRQGLIGCIDLEEYDYRAGSTALIRATEGTVLERIPPRMEVRRGAELELPHVMLLMDDASDTVIAPLRAQKDSLPLAYRFPLMLGGGAVEARFLPAPAQADVEKALDALCAAAGDPPLLFAVGDGNHSLATAKACYEEIKAELGDAAATHPARYALVEVVNIHDEALQFEPIYRVVFSTPEKLPALLAALRRYAEACAQDPRCAAYPAQTLRCVRAEGEEEIVFPHGTHTLPVGTLQRFLDGEGAAYGKVDYIHGEDSLRALATRPGAIGFLFSGMRKEDLFPAILQDGPLPRKTFSMGEARDKRYYVEARRIR